jgi:transposase-like protein/DNA-directed RNA polymerase subunit RPC12/RpoP
MKVKKCTITQHRKFFGTDEQCNLHLCDIKWKSGYKCRKCEHKVFIKGRMTYDRRCQKCGFNESPTSGTLFHSTKLALSLIFEIIYRIAVNKKGLSAISIAREYGVNQKTADRLHFKIQHAMKPHDDELLNTEVHIDEFFFGGKEENKQGRCADSEKLRAALAVEILPNDKGIGRVYAMHIENFSAEQLIKIFDKYCEPETLIITDKWRGYAPIVNHFPNLNQILSEKGEAFPELHIVILLIKKFLKGIHHTISKQRFQNYLDEFSYRFNRRNFIESINENLIYRMAKHNPMPNKRMLQPNKMAA